MDGHNFSSLYAGSIGPLAADGTVYPQRVNRGVHGIKFGTHMERAYAADINSLKTAVQTAEAAAQAIRVQLQNALYTIDVWAVPDYDQQSWITEGDESEGVIENVTMRFASMALHT